MVRHSNEYKRKAGALLLRLKNNEFGMTHEEWNIAEHLADIGMARYRGPDPGPKVMTIEEGMRHNTLAALAHYKLSGIGLAFVSRHSEKCLQNGQFNLPDETLWYDKWYWKILLPGLVALVVSAFTFIVKEAFFSAK